MRRPFSLRRILAIARKEAMQIRRDGRSLALAFLFPLVLMVLFGSALSLDVDRVPLAVLDRDGTFQSADLIARFTGSPYFTLARRAGSEREIDDAIDRRVALLALMIPAGFGADVLSGRTAQVLAASDGSDAMTAQFALGYARGIAAAWNAEVRPRSYPSAVDLRARAWYNPGLKSRIFTVSGLIALVMIIVGAILTALCVAREWERGTMEQLLATPVRQGEILAGKFLPYFAIGVFDLVAAILLAMWGFGVPLRGSPLLLASLSSLFLAGALAQGILISSATRNQLMANQLALLTSFLPAFLLSGFFAPIINMPPVIRAITYLLPARYAMEISRGIMLKGVGLETLWPQALALFAYTSLMFLLARRAFARKLA
jgi:ABC-2 type transport system permease protein